MSQVQVTQESSEIVYNPKGKVVVIQDDAEIAYNLWEKVIASQDMIEVAWIPSLIFLHNCIFEHPSALGIFLDGCIFERPTVGIYSKISPTPVYSGSIAGANDVPEPITGLNPGQLYCFETTSFYKLRTDLQGSSMMALIIDGHTCPDLGTGVGYASIDSPPFWRMALHPPQLVFAEQIGVTNHVRGFFIAGNSNAFITSDGMRADNADTLSISVYPAASGGILLNNCAFEKPERY